MSRPLPGSSSRLLLAIATAVAALALLWAGAGAARAATAVDVGLAAVPLDGQVALSWSPVDGADTYVVRRAVDPATPSAAITPSGGVTGTGFTDTGVTDGTTYTYTVTASAAGQTVATSLVVAATPVARACAGANPTVAENCHPGGGGWRTNDVRAVEDGGIEGFATPSSIDAGDQIDLKVNSPAAFDVEVWRTGGYGGDGGRLFSVIRNVPATAQAACFSAPTTTGVVDCSAWTRSLRIGTSEAWPSGVYLLRLERRDNGSDTHVLLTVRDDDRQADVLFGVGDTTYQAYNNYGGKSLYDWNSTGANTVAGTDRAVKVSFDRPYSQPLTGQRDWYTAIDLPAVRWLEDQGYDVSYASGVDVERDPGLPSRYAVYWSGAHDEYWSRRMRDGVEGARDSGTSLFFSGANAVYWQVRFEASTVSGDARRVMVSYKSVQSGGADPQGPTSTWRDPAGANDPENALVGIMYVGDSDFTYFPLRVSAEEGQDPVWRHTPLAQQAPGTSTDVGGSLVGWEWDARVANGREPAGLVTLASSPVSGSLVTGNGSGYTQGPATVNVSRYAAASGATVFATGTNHWTRGLGRNQAGEGEPNLTIGQATTNVLVDMGAPPATPSSSITVSTQTAPTVFGRTPAPGATGVPVASGVTARFSVAMDAATLGSGSLTLTGPGSQPVAGTVAYDAATRTLTFDPAADLAQETTYTATIAGTVRGADGTPIAGPVTWTFETRTPPPPAVSGRAPADGATAVAANATVRATFDVAMDETTLGSGALTLTGPGSQQVTGALTYDAPSRTLTFTPDTALAADTTYTARVAGTVESAEGVAIAAPVSWQFTTAGTSGGPTTYSLLDAALVPANPALDTQDGRTGSGPFTYELGVKVQATAPAEITHVRFYKSPGETGTHTVRVFTSGGTQIAQAQVSGETPSGWQQQALATPVVLAAGDTVVVSVNANARFPFTLGGLATPRVSGPIQSVAGSNGVFATEAGQFPTSSYQDSNYFVDVVAVDGDPAAAPAPTVSGRAPADGATAVATDTTVRATFDVAMDQTTLGAGALTLTGPGSQQVTGALTYDAPSRTLTFTPAATLASGTTYTARVAGTVTSAAGTTIAAPVTWQFTTAPAGGGTTYSLLDPAVAPANPALDTQDGRSGAGPFTYELGVKVQATAPAEITHVRFYKSPGETGTHTVRVFTTGGTQIAQAQVTGESASGWQQQALASPVALAAGDTVVVSVNANARFPFTLGGLATPRVSGPIQSVAGSNGVFATEAGQFPTSSYLDSNYFVDVVAVDGQPAPPAAPAVTGRAPADGATAVATDTTVRATFDVAMDQATLGSGALTLAGPGSQQVTGALTYDAPSRTLTLTPAAALAADTTYTARVAGTVKSAAGGTIAAPVSWQFTTAPAAGPPTYSLMPTETPQFPALDTQDGRGGPGPWTYELGMKVQANAPARITHVRFYKSPGETGTHTVRVFTTGGTQIAQAQVSGESASGWQQQALPSPVILAAGDTVVVSVNANARFPFTASGLATPKVAGPVQSVVGSNGVFSTEAGQFPTSSYQDSNYFVDVVAVSDEPAPPPTPAVSSRTPADGATGVATDATVRATFDIAMDPATLTAGALTLTGPGAQPVAGSLAYDATSRTLTLTPASALEAGTTYTARVADTARSAEGVAVAGAVSWSFTTVAPAPVVTGRAPADGATAVATDTTVRATFDVAMDQATLGSGALTLTGPGGQAVAGSLTYDAPSRTLTLTPAAALAADTTYTARVAGTVKSAAGGTIAAPVSWTFTTVAPTPAVATRTPADGATAVATSTTVAATFDIAMDPATLTAGALTVTNPGGQQVAGALAYDAASRTLTFTPTAALTNSTVYTARVAGTVRSAQGITIAAPVSWTFTTVAPTPAVTTRTPADGATGVAVNTTVRAAFDLAMDPATLTAGALTVTNPGGQQVAGALAYDANSRTLTFTPTAALANSTVYTARVAGTVASAQGVTLAAPVSWQFTTVAPTPAVATRTPADGATAVATGTTVAATFDIAMDPATLTAGALTVTNPGGQQVAGALAYDANSRTLTFTPTAALANSTVYTARVAGTVRSAQGITIAAPVSWTFTTVAPTPAVTSRTPATGATGVATNSPVRVTFDIPMDTATLTAGALTVTNAAGQQVAGSTAYDATSRTLTFTPATVFANGTVHTARVAGTVRSAQGITLAAPVTWQFTTAATTTTYSLMPTLTPGLTNFGSREVGVRIQATAAADITHVRFFKSSGETGTHTVRVFTSTGTLITSATVTGETASGWQQQALPQRVSVAAGSTVVVSVNANSRYPSTLGGLATARISGPIRTVVGGNGVFSTTIGQFPTSSLLNSNYFVDVVAMNGPPA